MSSEKPLWWKLYFDQLYADFARIVGYAGIALEEARTRAEPLGEQYGKEKVQAAANEISKLEDGRINLTPKAQKACWQLLGPPPEKLEEFHRPTLPPPPLKGPDAVQEETAKKKRPRKAKAS